MSKIETELGAINKDPLGVYQAYHIVGGEVHDSHHVVVLDHQDGRIIALDVDPRTGEAKPNVYSKEVLEGLTPSHIFGGIVLERVTTCPVDRREYEAGLERKRYFLKSCLEVIKMDVARRLGIHYSPKVAQQEAQAVGRERFTKFSEPK